MVFTKGKTLHYAHRKNKIIKKRRLQAIERVERLRKNPTKAEKRLKRLLNSLKIRYVFQYPIITEWVFAIPDFYLPYKNLIIEVDGKIHKRSDIVKKDEIHNSFYLKKGFKVLRFTNEEVEQLDKRKLMEIIIKT